MRPRLQQWWPARVDEPAGIRRWGSFIDHIGKGFDETVLFLEHFLNADKILHLLLGGGFQEIFGG